MRLEQLTYVVAIADRKSISKAAKDLYLTQPALSNGLKDLENELGFSIFEREKKGVSLTAKGTELYELARSIQNDLQQIARLSEKERHVAALSIAATPMACGYMFLEMLDTIKIAFPSLAVHAFELRPRQLAQRLKSGSVNIALYSCPLPQRDAFSQRIAQLGLEQEQLLCWPMAVFISSKHPLASESILSLEQLRDVPKISFVDLEPGASTLLPKGNGKTQALYSFSDRGSIKDAVAHGKGYALLPISMAIDDVYCDCGKIRVIPLRETSLISLDLIHPKSKLLYEEEITILQILRDYIRNMDTRIIRTFWGIKSRSGTNDIELPY